MILRGEVPNGSKVIMETKYKALEGINEESQILRTATKLLSVCFSCGHLGPQLLRL
jgi:hypothetical protein